jgi:hypothetical protein
MRANRRRTAPSAIEPLESRVFLSAASVIRALSRATAEPTYRLLNHGSLKANGTSSPSGGISPSQMVQAYGVNAITFGGVTGNGAGQTIAIIDAYNDPNAASDLAAFDSHYGLPAPPSFKQLNQTGGTTLPSNSGSTGWSLEESLDIEWSHVIAPDASIILYEANSASDSNLISAAVTTAKNNANVTVVSMSFGGGEFSGENTLDSVFTSPHTTFVASTGDSGSPAGYPSYSPNVVAVGGTTLSVTSSGNWTGETAWSDSGGGTSAVEAEPAFQTSVQSTGLRTTPDVSMDADPGSGVPVYDSYDEGASTPWITVGGTSLASPMFAGLIAITNQGRRINGLPVLSTQSNPAATNNTQALPLIYSAAQSDFHDITSGNNGDFSAGPGYDEVTGRGSPIANKLVQYLAGLPSWMSQTSSALWDGSTNTLTITGPAKMIADPGTAEPMVIGTASVDQLAIQPTLSDVDIHLRGMQLSNGAGIDVVSVGASRSNINHNTLVLGTLGAANDPTFSVDSSSKVNVEDNDLIVHSGSSDPTGSAAYAMVNALAVEGRNPASGAPGSPDGQWNGSGLDSSAATTADTAAGYEKIALGVVLNSTLFVGPFSSWQVGTANETLAASDIIVKYTYLGDYGLFGKVYDSDAAILQRDFDNGKTNTHTWATGSSMGNGLSDASEAGVLQFQYGLGTGGREGPQL